MTLSFSRKPYISARPATIAPAVAPTICTSSTRAPLDEPEELVELADALAPDVDDEAPLEAAKENVDMRAPLEAGGMD